MGLITITSAGLSDIGKIRQSNQDLYLLDTTHHLYVVADGMGGHQAGEVASRIVVESIHKYYTAMDHNHGIEADTFEDSDLSPEAHRMRAAIRYANQQVWQAAAWNKAYAGMGSTIAAVKFIDNLFVAANVGDSPIYLVHEGSIETISVAHTLLAEQKNLSAEDRAFFGTDLQHLLTRGMGVDETVQPDICESPCFTGDCLVVCSDGLSGKVDQEEILEVVTSQGPGAACHSLVELANQRGGEDNITVIVLQVIKQNSLMQRFYKWIARFTGSGLPDA